MPLHVLDTSAVVKYYHQEAGSAEVSRLVDALDTRRMISRLTVVEVHSSFATNLRTLDALQLAVTLGIHRRVTLDKFVCADARLSEVVTEEQIAAINYPAASYGV